MPINLPNPCASKDADTLILVNNLRIQSADKIIVNGLSFCLKAGQTLGIMAPSGQGKTTAMLGLLGLLPDSLRVDCDEYIALGQSMNIHDKAALSALCGQQIGYLFQEPKLAMNPVHTIAQGFDTLFHLVDMPKAKHHEQMLALLAKAKLPAPKSMLQRYPHTLSGGEARRVSIAQLLALRPRIIIADEPTSGLDGELHGDILDLLMSLKDANTGIIIISHDREVNKSCDKLLAFNDTGVQYGDAKTLLAQLPKLDYGTAPMLPTAVSKDSDAVLTLSEFSISYQHRWRFWQKTPPLFAPLHLSLKRGEIVGVVGRSGSGKTSLAHAIAHLADNQQVTGSITILGENLSQLKGARLRVARRQVQLVMQDARASLNPTRTIGESLLEAIHPNGGRLTYAENQALSELLTLCGLSVDVLPRLPSTLSGGECQRICIVRALLPKPSLLILDEPTAMLDSLSIMRLLDLLRTLQHTLGITMILVSHDRAVVDALCHRVVDLD